MFYGSFFAIRRSAWTLGWDGYFQMQSLRCTQHRKPKNLEGFYGCKKRTETKLPAGCNMELSGTARPARAHLGQALVGAGAHQNESMGQQIWRHFDPKISSAQDPFPDESLKHRPRSVFSTLAHRLKSARAELDSESLPTRYLRYTQHIRDSRSLPTATRSRQLRKPQKSPRGIASRSSDTKARLCSHHWPASKLAQS